MRGTCNEDYTPNLWFDGYAEEAAEFYTSLFPDIRIERLMSSPADNPSAAKGELLVVEFTGRNSSGSMVALRADRRWRRTWPVRLVPGPFRPLLAGRSPAADGASQF